MVLSISLPDAVYVYLSYFQDASMLMINTCVFVEQFGYGFGFTAYMLYLIYFSRGERSTAVYAFCTGLMALGMMLPGMMAGWIEEQIGYRGFFSLVMACTVITAIVSALLKIDPSFGRKSAE
jgi:PAT family beta-lactamase induction signal transducer AmpG